MTDLSQEEYRKVLRRCWEVPGLSTFDTTFPEEVDEWLKHKSKALGVPLEYLAFPLLAAIAYTMGESAVELNKQYTEPVIVYTLVAGRSGTNKPGSLDTIKSLISKLVVKNNDIEHVFDTGTLEGLLCQLKLNDGSILGAPDEFSSFIDNLDKNSNGNSDRARYLSLHSGSSWAKRIKGGGSMSVKNPRFNFMSFIQNYPLANTISRQNHYEGFYPRFLIATPKEVFTKFGDKFRHSEQEDNVDMQQIVQMIYDKHHEKKRNSIKITPAAIDILADYHDNVVVKYREENPFDETKTMLLAKSMSNVIRVAAIQSAIRVAMIQYREEFDNVMQDVEACSNHFSDDEVISTGVSLSNATKEDDNEFSSSSPSSNVEADSNHLSEANESSSSSRTVNVTETREESASSIDHITAVDMKRALQLVTYSVNCTALLCSAELPIKTKKADRKLPSPNLIGDEFIIMNKMKIRKMYSHKLKINNCIPCSVVTRDHLYPQYGGMTGKDVATNFLQCLQKKGLGVLYAEEAKPYFQFVDINDTENQTPEVLSLLDRLQLQQKL